MPRVQVLSTLKTFNEVIAKNNVTIIDFWATWCGPCKMISPVFEKLSDNEKYKDVEFYKVDVDSEPEIAQEVGIRAMPTFMVFKDGNKIDSLSGAVPAKLTSILDNAVQQ